MIGFLFGYLIGSRENVFSSETAKKRAELEYLVNYEIPERIRESARESAIFFSKIDAKLDKELAGERQ